jgi:predicted dithiol-disulfide oxidoreductase (DUF899 family)
MASGENSAIAGWRHNLPHYRPARQSYRFTTENQRAELMILTLSYNYVPFLLLLHTTLSIAVKNQ